MSKQTLGILLATLVASCFVGYMQIAGGAPKQNAYYLSGSPVAYHEATGEILTGTWLAYDIVYKRQGVNNTWRFTVRNWEAGPTPISLYSMATYQDSTGQQHSVESNVATVTRSPWSNAALLCTADFWPDKVMVDGTVATPIATATGFSVWLGLIMPQEQHTVEVRKK